MGRFQFKLLLSCLFGFVCCLSDCEYRSMMCCHFTQPEDHVIISVIAQKCSQLIYLIN